MKRVTHFLLASCLFPAFLGAQGVVGTSFLEITPDAQSAGMAGTGLAITDNGSTAIFHNASTIAFSQEVMGASYTYADVNKNYSMHSASLFYRIGREGKRGVTLGFRHFKEAKMLDSRPHIWDLEAAYFSSITKNLSLSLTFRYLQEKAYKDASSQYAMCLDMGASYHQNMDILNEMASWTIGLQVANVGGDLNKQKLPARLGLGGALDLPFSMDHRLQVALDLHYLLPSEYSHFQAAIGAEYNFLKYGVLRSGYHWGDKDKGIGNYGTLGGGINFWPIRADLSYALAGKECFMHRTWQLSIGVVF